MNPPPQVLFSIISVLSLSCVRSYSIVLTTLLACGTEL